jgi:hypothetical protein
MALLDEAFPNRKRKPSEKERVSYRAQLTDYDYICNTTGVCPLEEFTEPAKKKCEPLQPPKYEYPLSDKDKEKFRKALKIAIEQMENETPPPTLPHAPPLQNTNADIAGLIDEELDQYMKLKEAKKQTAGTKEPSTVYQKADFPDIPVDKPPISEDKLKDIPGSPPGKPFANVPERIRTADPKLWTNLLLFVLGGILLIFLLEQFYKLISLVTMRRTVEAMEYIVREIKNQSLTS